MMEVVSEDGMVLGYKKKTLAMVAIVVLVVGAAFYAGAKYEKAKLTRLGLLSGSAKQSQVSEKKTKSAPVVTVQKFADQDYFKTAYLISGVTLSADAKMALTGFTMTKKTMPDGTTSIMLKALKPEYKDQSYTLKTGEQLYFIEKFLQDDANGTESNIGDDGAVIVNAEGNVVSGPMFGK